MLNLLTPDGTLVSAETYNKLFTLHGIMMVFFFLVPSVPAVLGNFALPLMLGAKDVAFPKINLLSWYIFIAGGSLELWALISGGVDTGWTFYTPFSTTFSNTNVITAALAIFIAGFSSILTGLNFIVTVHRMRAPGLTWFKLPLFVWSTYATSIIQVLGTPVIAIGRSRSISPITQASADCVRDLAALNCLAGGCGTWTLERSDHGTDAADHGPRQRRLLDKPLEPPPRDRQEIHRPAAPCGSRAVIEQSQTQIGPFQLVALVTDREIESPQPELDRISKKLAQVERAGPVTGQLVIAIARQHMIIAVAERNREIRRRACCSDFQTTDMGQVPRLRI